jgi:VanZ family protein
VGWTVVVLLLTLLPGKDLPGPSFLDLIPQFDKVVHAGLFFIFVIAWSFGSYRSGALQYPKKILTFTILAVALGILIECIQLEWKAIHRDFELMDITADTIGALLGAWISRKFLPGWLRRNKKAVR